MSMATGICEPCKKKLELCYNAYPAGWETVCAFCGKPGMAYELVSKRKRKKKQITVSTGLRADKENYIRKRSWG